MSARVPVRAEDIPDDVRDRLGRFHHRWQCGAFDAGMANRWEETYRYTGEHRERDKQTAAVLLADVLNRLCVPVDEFLLIMDRRLWR